MSHGAVTVKDVLKALVDERPVLVDGRGARSAKVIDRDGKVVGETTTDLVIRRLLERERIATEISEAGRRAAIAARRASGVADTCARCGKALSMHRGCVARRDACAAPWYCRPCKVRLNDIQTHCACGAKLSDGKRSRSERRRLASAGQTLFRCKQCVFGERKQPSHCPVGHEYTEENTRWKKRPNGRATIACRTCTKEGLKRSRSKIGAT